MNNLNIYHKLLSIINKEKDLFTSLVNSDNTLTITTTPDEITNALEFSSDEKIFSLPIVGNIIITEGDILSILAIIHDLAYYEGEYTLYINNASIATITYLVKRVNSIYEEYKLPVKIKISYESNYNDYLNSLVTIIGSKDFVLTSSKDFGNANQIIV